MWTSSKSHQPYNSNNGGATKTIKRCNAIEEESFSEKLPLLALFNKVCPNDNLFY